MHDAHALLKHEVREFTEAEMRCIADALSAEIAGQKYACYACAVMPDHVHVIIRKHKHAVEEMIANLRRATHLLLRERGHFDLEHPIWGGHGWSVFLDCPEDVWRTIPCVENNPRLIGLPTQKHDFVTPYDNWPLHEGHSPNSPYARRLRRRES